MSILLACMIADLLRSLYKIVLSSATEDLNVVLSLAICLLFHHCIKHAASTHMMTVCEDDGSHGFA